MRKYSPLLLALSIIASTNSVAASPMRVDVQELGSGYIYLPCTFDSHEEECLLDTGSDVSNIRDDSFSETYASAGKTTGAGLTGEPTVCDLIDVSRVGFGDGFASRPKLARCPSSVQNGESVIGLSSLTGKTIHIDFPANQFSITDHIPAGSLTAALTFYPLGHFGFSSTIANATVNTVIDTGAAITTIDQDFVRAHPDAFNFIETIPGKDANGDPISFALFEMRAISFGAVTLENVSVLAGDFSEIAKYLPGVSLITGYNIIAQRNWYFDLLNKAWLDY